MHSAEVAQDIILAHAGFEGAIDLSDARIGGSVLADGAVLDRSDAPLIAERIRVGGMIRLNGIAMQGMITFLGAQVENQVSLRGAWLYAPDETAVRFDGARIGADLFLDEDFTCYGQIRLNRATIGSKLYLDSARIFFPKECALFADRVRVGLGVDFSGSYVQGAVAFEGADIGGHFAMENTIICCRYPALHLDGSRVGDLLSVRHSLLRGGAKIIQADMVRGISFTGSKFIASNEFPHALALDGTRTMGNVHLDDGFVAIGTVVLSGCDIQGQVELGGATVVATPDYAAVMVENTRVVADFRMESTTIPSINFVDSHIHSLILPNSLSGIRSTNYYVLGLHYDNIYGIVARSRRAGLAWLTSGDWNADFAIDPYQRLADHYMRLGHDKDARFVRFYVALRQAVSGRSLRTYKTWLRFLMPSSWPRAIYGLGTGFGYYPLVTLAWLIVVIASVAMVVIAPHREAFVPTKSAISISSTSSTAPTPSSSHCTSSYPCFSPWLFAADVVVPVIPIGQEENWRVDAAGENGSARPIRWILTAVSGFGWLLTTFFVAGITGLLRRGGR